MTNDAAKMQRNEEIRCENSSGSEDCTWWEDAGLEDTEAFISACLRSAARNVIAVGYYLKHIRDHELYLEVGYQNIWDYARERFGFSRSTASRYMSRNDRFSKDGNSPVLDERYSGYSKSQLQEMLSLDESQLEQVTPNMTVKEIRGMRQPREIPYYDIEGQMDFETCFPDVMPAEPAPAAPLLPAAVNEKQEFEMDISELVGRDVAGAVVTTVVATSQQIGERDDGNEGGIPERKDKEAVCEESKSGMEERGAEEQPEPPRALEDDQPRTVETVQTDNAEDSGNGVEDEKPDGGEAGEQVRGFETEEIAPAQNDAGEPEPYNERILEEMIVDTEKYLEVMGDYWKENLPDEYVKHRMQLLAYKNLLELHQSRNDEQTDQGE